MAFSGNFPSPGEISRDIEQANRLALSTCLLPLLFRVTEA